MGLQGLFSRHLVFYVHTYQQLNMPEMIGLGFDKGCQKKMASTVDNTPWILL